MPRPIWKGFISFGLVAIPVNMIAAEEKNELHFHLLDERDKARIRYQRINAETGKEVPWDKIIKAYEIEKNQYVVLKEEDFQKASPESYKTIEINEFVDLADIDPMYFEKPYYLLPEGKNKKAYVLLREALKKTKSVGVGKIIIRTKEYLSLILPHHHALVLNLIRFKQEMRSEDELNLPSENLKTYQITEKESKMASDLVKEMTTDWNPDKYHDEYHETLMKWIEQKAASEITTTKPSKTPKYKDEVIDFVALLKKSMEKKSSTKQRKSR
jgi:DNA end-binding protein Ku